jgi:hypothetical protein
MENCQFGKRLILIHSMSLWNAERAGEMERVSARHGNVSAHWGSPGISLPAVLGRQPRRAQRSAAAPSAFSALRPLTQRRRVTSNGGAPLSRNIDSRPGDELQLVNPCVLAGTFRRRAALAAPLAIAAKISHFRDKLPTHRASQRPEALPRSELEIAMTEFHFPDRKLLPPIAALRAFDAAARLGSFTIAAEELGVTQGAVSRQIRLLEDLLQVTLFDRSHHRVVPTDAGHH